MPETHVVVRSNFLARQQYEQQILRVMYNTMKVGEEETGWSTKRLAELCGIEIKRSRTVDAFVHNAELAGILSRRITYKPGWQGGRVGNWTLNMSYADAVSALNEIHSKEIEELKPRATSGDMLSLKMRAYQQIRDHGPYNSPNDLARAMSQPGEGIDIRRLTRVLGALKDEGLVIFKRDGSGRHHKGKQTHGQNKGVFYDIRVQGNEKMQIAEESIVQHVPARHHSVGVDNTDFRNLPKVAPGGPIEKSLPIVKAPSIEERYPLILKLVNRRMNLEAASALAEAAGEVDMALDILSRVDTLSPLDAEIINLWQDFANCVGKDM